MSGKVSSVGSGGAQMTDMSVALEGAGYGAGGLRLQRQVSSFPGASGEDSLSSSAGWAASVSLAAAATDKPLQKHRRTVLSKRTCWALSSGSTSWPW